MADKVGKGELVYIDYEAWIVNPNGHEQLYETTSAEKAREHRIFSEKRVYAEMPVVVGKDRLMKGLDEALLSATLDEEAEVVIPPEKGMGERDPKLVELIPLRDFHRQEIEPAPGMEVSIRSRRGTVTAVTAGRVRVDFNNPLAGRTLKYRYRVTKRAASPEELVLGIIEMDYGPAQDFKVEVKGPEADVHLPDICKTDERWFVAKFRVVGDLREVGGISRVRFIEEYRKMEEPTEAKETKEAQEASRVEERVEEEIPPEERQERPPQRPEVAAEEESEAGL